jgi:hypothetical protein
MTRYFDNAIFNKNVLMQDGKDQVSISPHEYQTLTFYQIHLNNIGVAI